MKTTRILNAFYPGASAARAQVGRTRRLWSIMRGTNKARSAARKWIPYLVVGSLAVTAWIIFLMYYYNLLVDLEFDVNASWAQVEAQLQRRDHIQQNLTQIVMDYAEYEPKILTDLIKMRTSMMAGKQAAGDGADKATAANQQAPAELSLADQLKQLMKSKLDKLFPDIMLVAEQYPELKLTENLQQFSAAIVDTENQIAERIMAYNEAVNIYTTTRTQFPGNFFGATFGFSMYDYHEPDKELLNFRPVKY